MQKAIKKYKLDFMAFLLLLRGLERPILLADARLLWEAPRPTALMLGWLDRSLRGNSLRMFWAVFYADKHSILGIARGSSVLNGTERGNWPTSIDRFLEFHGHFATTSCVRTSLSLLALVVCTNGKLFMPQEISIEWWRDKFESSFRFAKGTILNVNLFFRWILDENHWFYNGRGPELCGNSSGAR